MSGTRTQVDNIIPARFTGDALTITVDPTTPYDSTNSDQLAQINGLASASSENITASVTGTPTSLTGLTTGSSDVIKVNVTGNYTSQNGGVSALNDLRGVTNGVITAGVEGTVNQLTGLQTNTNDQITLVPSGSVSPSDVTTLNSISALTFDSYSLAATVAQVNAYSNINNLISRASDATITEARSTNNTALKLKEATSLTNLGTLNYTGTDVSNIVELSHALSSNSSDNITLNFGDSADASDTDNDVLVFNVDETNTAWTTFTGQGAVNSGASTLKFVKVDNFDLTSKEDKFGVFYSGSNGQNRTGQSLVSSAVTLGSQVFTFDLLVRDGKIYEDQAIGLLTADQAKDVVHIKNRIAEIVTHGGTSFNADEIGSTEMDFTYIAYGTSQDNSSQTSAYIYAGKYNDSGVAPGAGVDQTKLSIAALGEITNTTLNEIDGTSASSYQLTKPSQLS